MVGSATVGVREQRKQARRLAIEQAAVELILAGGYERCSVERIAASVGIARGTFYLYYADKQVLFEALCERLYGPIVRAVQLSAAALAAAESLDQQRLLYLQMAAGLASQVETVQPYLMLHFREQRSAGPSGEIVRVWVRRLEDLAIQILQDAADRGLIHDVDPVTVALAIFGSVERLLWAWVTGDSRLDPDRAGLQLANVFFQGIAR